MSAKDILAEIRYLSVRLSRTSTITMRLYIAKRIQKRQAQLKKMTKKGDCAYCSRPKTECKECDSYEQEQ